MLFLVLLLAAGLRTYHIDTTSLWTDELFTRAYAGLGLRFLWGPGLRLEPNPQLYYSLISLWERVAGDSAFALRFPSLLASLAGIALAAAIGRELRLREGGVLLGTLLLALAPTNILYAQEARAYALQGAALALAMLGFAQILSRPGRTLPYALYGVGAVLAIYFHLTSALAVAGFNGAALSAAFGRRRLLPRPALLRWLGANLLVALACLPLLPVLLAGSAGEATSWIAAFDRYELERELGVTLIGPAILNQALAACEITVLLLLVLILIPPWRPGRRVLTVLVIGPALFLLLMIGASLLKPVILGRTLAWLLLPLALVLGDVLARRMTVLTVAVLAMAGLALGLHLRHIDHVREDWADFLAGLPGLAPPALVVLAPHTSPAALALYAPGSGPPVRLDGGFPSIVETTLIPALYGTKTIDMSTMRDAIAAGRAVWLIVRRPDVPWLQRAVAGLPPPQMELQDPDGQNPAIRALRW